MRRLPIVGTLLCMVLCLGLALAQDKQATSSTPSLGELARQLKAAREKEQQKPAKVYTNDNLPPEVSTGGLAVAAGISGSSPEEKSAAEVQQSASQKSGERAKPAATPTSQSKEGAHDEEYYRTRMSELQSQLDLHQRELSVLRQKLSLNEMQYYPDPNKALQQEYSRSDINKLNEDIQNKQQQVTTDQQAIQELRDQLRREGGDPGWLR